jgi:hypothetical protein
MWLCFDFASEKRKRTPTSKKTTSEEQSVVPFFGSDDDDIPLNVVAAKVRDVPQRRAPKVPKLIRQPRAHMTDSNDFSKRLKSKTSTTAFIETISGLTPLQMDVVREMGFGSVFDWMIKDIPSRLAYWLADRFDPVACTVKLNDGMKEIRITEKDVETYLGLPRGPKTLELPRYTKNKVLLQELREDCRKPDMQEGRVTDVNTLRPSFVRERMSMHDGDDWFKRYFIMLFITSVVESKPNVSVNLRVLDLLEDTSRIREFDWCGFVFNKLIECSREWQLNKEGFWRGPMLFLMVKTLSI